MNGMRVKDIAARFNVQDNTVYNIIEWKTHRSMDARCWK